MKTISALLFTAIAATTASAHTAAAPHVHEGSQISWTPALACSATLLVAVYFAFRAARSSKNKQSR